jgi:hypothetical protein
MEQFAEILRSALPTELWTRATILLAEDEGREADEVVRARLLLEQGRGLLRSAEIDRGLACLVASLIAQSSAERADPISATAILLEVLDYLDDPQLRQWVSSRGFLPSEHPCHAKLQCARLHAKAQVHVDQARYSEAAAVIDDLQRLIRGDTGTIPFDSPLLLAYLNARHLRASSQILSGEIVVAGYELAELALWLQHATRPDLLMVGHRFGRSLVTLSDHAPTSPASKRGTLHFRFPWSVPSRFTSTASSSYILPMLPLPVVLVGVLFASFPQVAPPFRWGGGIVAGVALLLAVGLALWRYISASVKSVDATVVMEDGFEVVGKKSGEVVFALPWSEVVSIAFVGGRASEEPCLVVPLTDNKGKIRFGVGGLHAAGVKCICQKGEVGGFILPKPAARLPLFVLVDMLVRRSRPREEMLPAGTAVETRLRCCDRPDLETTKSLSSDRHGTCALRRCRTCGQPWLYRWDEWVDSSGPDRSTTWYWPLSEEERARIEAEGSEHGLVESEHDRTVYMFEQSDDRPGTVFRLVREIPERFF